MIFTTAYAATPGAAETAQFVALFNQIILYPVIVLLTAVALLVFIYGCFLFVANADNPSGREEGRRHILYGLIGMLVMLMAYTILSIAANTFGLDKDLECANDPSASGCDQYLNSGGTGNSGGGTGNSGGGTRP